jgi:trigger factor
MSIKIEKTENNNELKLEFTIEAKKFDEAIIKVFNKSAKYFNIPGFRKGKAPFNIVERMYGDEIFYEDAFNELVPSIYEKEIEDNKLDVVSKPEINIVKMIIKKHKNTNLSRRLCLSRRLKKDLSRRLKIYNSRKI